MAASEKADLSQCIAASASYLVERGEGLSRRPSLVVGATTAILF
jgi:hypothetical protein